VEITCRVWVVTDDTEELEARRGDRAIEHPVEVVVIGGAAAALEYGVISGTRDIDTWTRVREDLAVAARRARLATGLPVPLAQRPSPPSS
jgi:hypothetical protein